VPSSHFNLDPVARVHPKLPDYDELAARFEALKYRKS
jgi:vacuolar protein sorting-associated protein IST1